MVRRTVVKIKMKKLYIQQINGCDLSRVKQLNKLMSSKLKEKGFGDSAIHNDNVYDFDLMALFFYLAELEKNKYDLYKLYDKYPTLYPLKQDLTYKSKNNKFPRDYIELDIRYSIIEFGNKVKEHNSKLKIPSCTEYLIEREAYNK